MSDHIPDTMRLAGELTRYVARLLETYPPRDMDGDAFRLASDDEGGIRNAFDEVRVVRERDGRVFAARVGVWVMIDNPWRRIHSVVVQGDVL